MKHKVNMKAPSKKTNYDLKKEIPKRKNKSQYVKPLKSITPEKIDLCLKTPLKNTNCDLKEEIPKKKKKCRYVMPSKSITPEIIDLCLNALNKLSEKGKNQGKIFEDEQLIFAEIHSIKIQNSLGRLGFVLPHSTVSSTGEVCLITKDLKKGRKPDHEPTVDHWEEILRKAGVTQVKTVLPMRQLRVEYDQFELKRRLLTQHDFIMVDTRVINHVSHLLGKMFFKKHNMLIPVRIDESIEKLKKCIDTGLSTAILRMNTGETSTITVGHTGMPQKHVKENVLALIKQLKEKFPGGESNIRALNLKLPLSMSVPLYLTLRSSNTVSVPKMKHRRPKSSVLLEDELSTIPGSFVRVAPDGTVSLKRKFASQDSDADSDDDEEENKKEVKQASDDDSD